MGRDGESAMAPQDPLEIQQEAFAFIKKAIALGEALQLDDAIAVYDEAVRRYGDRTEAGIAVLVAKALYNKAVLRGRAGLFDDAVDVCDEVLRRYADLADFVFAETVAKALFGKGVNL